MYSYNIHIIHVHVNQRAKNDDKKDVRIVGWSLSFFHQLNMLSMEELKICHLWKCIQCVGIIQQIKSHSTVSKGQQLIKNSYQAFQRDIPFHYGVSNWHRIYLSTRHLICMCIIRYYNKIYMYNACAQIIHYNNYSWVCPFYWIRQKINRI